MDINEPSLMGGVHYARSIQLTEFYHAHHKINGNCLG